ncbi:MAG: MFS transporter [Alphaproteobacteria bacterium]|nr:MFS transporter [Alphaproteobacteria bacterium]
MRATSGLGKTLAPFEARSFRFQWPADLLTSWAFEMETLILGWFILVKTESVLLLTAFAALQYIGALVAPIFGVAGDRVGRRTMLCFMRAAYALLAGALMTLGLMDALGPYHVFAIAALMGIIRPSDLVMRNSLIGDTMPRAHLMPAIGLNRTTQDTARIAGALAGAGLFSTFGLGAAYIFVVVFYLGSLLLTFGVSGAKPGDVAPASPNITPDAPPEPKPSAWADLKDGLIYVWRTPPVRATMWLAFQVNLTAYPILLGLMPYVAREIYHVDENGLGLLVASYASGALIGSLTMAWTGGFRRSSQSMIVFIFAWYALLVVFALAPNMAWGMAALVLIGVAQTTAMISMAVTLLRTVNDSLRGRVMGVRSLAIYSLPWGMVASGYLVEIYGYLATVLVYCATGVVFTALISFKYRDAFKG